jgi:bifunctional NMN adenylyltransferase/nudix hydrolase
MYKKQYSSLPYAPVFVTTDAVVICSGHILMIRRKSEPGKGLWALPGGFLNAQTDRSIQDAMIRELREETGIKVPSPVLIGNINKVRVFDAIDRSTRGRTITHVFKIDLPDGVLPKVRGIDDADKARFMPLSELDSAVCFEDHFEIISSLIA